MKLKLFSNLASFALLTSTACAAEKIFFKDDFEGKLGSGWSWIREHNDSWRVKERALQIRIEPGNMWGPANDARNVLIHPLPDSEEGEVEISVSVENRPTEQYEQIDLVWYYDDSHMVKLGEELVDGKLSIVMGREEKDRTRTIAIIPLDSSQVRLQLKVRDHRIVGEFRTLPTGQWRRAGESDLPAHGTAKVSLQCYQGPAKAEHWAQITEFRILQRP